MLSGAVLVAAWAMTSAPVAGQAKPPLGPPLVITAYGGKTPSTPYKSPKTPWGEPDLIGVWSSDDTAGIPMSRPQQFADRLYQTDEEYATRAKNIETRATQGDNSAVGAFRFDYARRAFRQTSLIVDPPAGLQTRGVRPRDAARHLWQRPARLDDRLLDVRALHHARRARLGVERHL